MPGAAALATPVVGAAGLTVSTASFTVPAGELLVCMVVGRGTASTIPTLADSSGGTWTAFDAGIGSLAVCKSRLFWKLSTGAAQTLTATQGSGQHTAIVVLRSASAAVEATNYKTNFHATTTTRSITMNTYTAGAGCLYFIAASGNTAWGTPTGFAELYDAQIVTNTRIACGYDVTTPGTALSSTGGGVDTQMHAIELKTPAVSGNSVVKAWTGSAWTTEKPVMVWSGSAWVSKPTKIWNGSAWV